MADPIANLIKWINLPTRFTVVAVALVLAIAVPLVQVYRTESAKMRMTEKEIAWTNYVGPILPLIQAIDRHQRTWQGRLSGNEHNPATEHRAWVAMQAWATKLAQIDGRNLRLAGRSDMQLTVKELVDVVRHLPENPSYRQQSRVEESEDNAVTALWTLYSSAATAVNLSADRNPTNQRAMHALEDNLIELAVQTNRIQRAIIMARTQTHISGQWRVAAIETAQMIDWRSVNALVHDLGGEVNPSTPQGAALHRALTNLKSDGSQLLVAAQALTPQNRGRMVPLNTAAHHINRDIGHIFTLTLDNLRSGLEHRLSRLRITLLTNVGLVIVLTTIVCIIFYTMYRSLTGALLKKSLAERDLHQLNNLYATLSQVNRLVAHRCPQHQLFDEVCSIITKTAHFELAYIAITAARGKQCRLGHWAGSAADYLQAISHAQQKTLPSGLQPIDAALTGQSSSVIHDFKILGFDTPWAFALEKFGLRSAAAFPLIRKGHNFGVLAVYSSRPEGFTPRAVEVLSEIANSLSFAIEDSDRETLRRAAEQALRDSEARYHLVMEAAGDAIILMQSDGRILEVNRHGLDNFLRHQIDIPR